MNKKTHGSGIAEKAAILNHTSKEEGQSKNPEMRKAPEEREDVKAEPEKRRGLSGFVLKMIAIVSMFLDHVGAAVLEPLVNNQGISENGRMVFMSAYMILRVIGRLAFPIFCFLLVEGFFHTKNRWKYAERLGLFALISEIPFDLAFCQKLVDNTRQNVFFTLLIGFLTLIGLEAFEKKVLPVIQRGKKLYAIVGQLFIIALGFMAAVFLRTDYDGFGILLIAIFYLFHASKSYRTLIGALLFVTQNSLNSAAVTAFIPIWFYSGERGKEMKYFFYVFYPAHLLLLAFAGQYLLQVFTT